LRDKNIPNIPIINNIDDNIKYDDIVIDLYKLIQYN
jgi:hypothetical protein